VREPHRGRGQPMMRRHCGCPNRMYRVTQPLWLALQIEIHHFHLLDNMLKDEVQEQVNHIKAGITIDWVRITNVVIPHEIKVKRLFLRQKAKKKLAEEEALRTAVQKRTEAEVQAADLHRKLADQEMENQRLAMNVQAKLAEEDIKNQILLNATRAQAEKSRLEGLAAADKIRTAASAEADRIRLLAGAEAERMQLEATELRRFYEIPGYAEVQQVRALSANTKVYFGDRLPGNMWVGGAASANGGGGGAAPDVIELDATKGSAQSPSASGACGTSSDSCAARP